jgi:hypothetical protein
MLHNCWTIQIWTKHGLSCVYCHWQRRWRPISLVDAARLVERLGVFPRKRCAGRQRPMNSQSTPTKFNIPGSLSWTNGVSACHCLIRRNRTSTSSPLSNFASIVEIGRGERAMNTAGPFHGKRCRVLQRSDRSEADAIAIGPARQKIRGSRSRASRLLLRSSIS